jgi:hypothetical protein
MLRIEAIAASLAEIIREFQAELDGALNGGSAKEFCKTLGTSQGEIEIEVSAPAPGQDVDDELLDDNHAVDADREHAPGRHAPADGLSGFCGVAPERIGEAATHAPGEEDQAQGAASRSQQEPLALSFAARANAGPSKLRDKVSKVTAADVRIAAMRAILFVVLGGAAACGSVNPGTIDAAAGSDGATAANPGDLIWVRSMSAAFALGVAEGPGGVIFTGDITAPTDYGGGIMTPMGNVDLAIGDFKADDASYIYQARTNKAGGGQVYGFLTQTDTQGNPLVYGVSYGAVDLGKGNAPAGDPANALPADGWIGRYGPGAPAWVDRIVGPGEDKILTTATAPNGDFYAGGWFELTTSWNGGMLTTAGGRDMFVTRLNSFTGAVIQTKQFGGAGRDEIATIAGDGTSLILGGFFDDTINNFGGTAQPITATATAAGGPGSLDICVAKLDAAMAGVWAVRFGGTGEERGTAVAIDANGDVYVAGQFQGQVAFGAINLTATDTDPLLHDIFLAKLHGNNGSVAWAVQLGGAGEDRTARVVVDKAGHPVLTGSLNNDAVIASFDPTNGSIRWKTMVASPGTDSASGLAVGLTGDIYTAINVGGAVTFAKPLIGPPGPASVVMRIAP